MTALERPTAPQTRMLLASEGSTTTLLEAMLGEPLRLRLHEVRTTSGCQVCQAARAALGIEPGTPVLVRRSALMTAAGAEVSRNHVVARGPFEGELEQVLTGPDPIGWTMNGTRAGHSRLVLESGWSTWGTGGKRVTCAFKTYVMVEDARPRIHVFERFNPRFIPTGNRVVRQRRPADDCPDGYPDESRDGGRR